MYSHNISTCLPRKCDSCPRPNSNKLLTSAERNSERISEIGKQITSETLKRWCWQQFGSDNGQSDATMGKLANPLSVESVDVWFNCSTKAKLLPLATATQRTRRHQRVPCAGLVPDYNDPSRSFSSENGTTKPMSVQLFFDALVWMHITIRNFQRVLSNCIILSPQRTSADLLHPHFRLASSSLSYFPSFLFAYLLCCSLNILFSLFANAPRSTRYSFPSFIFYFTIFYCICIAYT